MHSSKEENSFVIQKFSIGKFIILIKLCPLNWLEKYLLVFGSHYF